MSGSNTVIEFKAGDDQLFGILHAPMPPHEPKIGVLIIVGGPQYRVGSHRQFVLLARQLADAGIPAFRFDYRGMGDSEGGARDFGNIDLDIRAALDTFAKNTGLEAFVLWGLCDAASAALIYAHQDERVAGLVLLNPWVHSAATEAKVRLRSYYIERLRTADFWKKITRLRFDVRGSFVSLVGYLKSALGSNTETTSESSFIERMLDGFESYRGRVLLVLSGNDITAGEFEQLCGDDARWRRVVAERVSDTLAMPDANHTFARQEWRNEVSKKTCVWVLEASQWTR